MIPEDIFQFAAYAGIVSVVLIVARFTLPYLFGYVKSIGPKGIEMVTKKVTERGVTLANHWRALLVKRSELEREADKLVMLLEYQELPEMIRINRENGIQEFGDEMYGVYIATLEKYKEEADPRDYLIDKGIVNILVNANMAGVATSIAKHSIANNFFTDSDNFDKEKEDFFYRLFTKVEKNIDANHPFRTITVEINRESHRKNTGRYLKILSNILDNQRKISRDIEEKIEKIKKDTAKQVTKLDHAIAIAEVDYYKGVDISIETVHSYEKRAEKELKND